MNSWRDQFELNFNSGATTEYQDGVAVRGARRIGVVAAGELDRGLEHERADLDADRIERRLVRQRDGGAAAARPGRIGARRNRATRPCARRRSRGAARRACVGAQGLASRRSVARGRRRQRLRRRWRRPALRRPVRCLVAACRRRLGLALPLALRLPEESKPVVPAPRRRLERRCRRRLGARVLGRCPMRWKRGGFFGSPSSCGRSSAELLSATASPCAPREARRKQRRERPRARSARRRDGERRRRGTPLPPVPTVRASRVIACPARAEKCVSDQTVPQISTAPGGPPGWAVRCSRALWLTEAKTDMVNGTLSCAGTSASPGSPKPATIRPSPHPGACASHPWPNPRPSPTAATERARPHPDRIGGAHARSRGRRRERAVGGDP